MKKLIFSVIASALSLAAFSQENSSKTFPDNQVITPFNMEVAFSKTVHILFPAAVKYVDLGSADIIAGKADGAENVVRVKASVKGFAGETNFSVITSDGCFYSFNAVYAEHPAQLNIEMEDWLRKNPHSDFANNRMYVRLKELSDETPLVVNRIMYTIHHKNARDIKSVGSKKFGIQILLKGVYINNDLMFLHTSMRNLSRVSYDIDYIRFKIVDKKIAKRTAVQETFVEPVRVFNNIVTVDGKTTVRNVFTFQKITIPDDKVLIVEIFEKNGGRHQSFAIENSTLINAKPIKELKIK